MAPKRKYGALEAPSQPTRYDLRERTAQGKVVRVNQRLQPSLQDPFHVLGDHEVRHIINLLEVRETETLRRVSRLWKASAEYHCERGRLLQHFPWMAPKISQSTTREVLNLLFRRCLYHQESLKAGLATRAIKFTGAREWHIRDSHVVWSNLKNCISTRLLRSPKASSSKSEMTRFEVKKLVPKGCEVKYVQAVSKDEILVTAQTHETKRDSKIIQSQKLLLISLSGKTKWITDIEDPSTRPAIGRTSLYLTTVRMVSVFTDIGESNTSLIKLSLSTGSIEMDKALPISDNKPWFQPAVVLDEEFLVLGLDTHSLTAASAAKHHIISTTTGSLIYSYTNQRRHSGVTATPSIKNNAVWVYGLSHTRLTQQNPFDKSWVTHEIHLPPCESPEPNKTVQRGFDGDRSLFSHLIHSRPSECMPSGRSEPHFFTRRASKFGVSTASRESEVLGGTTRPTEVTYTTSMPSLVTLPDGDGGRREFEIKLPLSDVSGAYYGAFFGFVDGYIAYHNKGEELLLLIDFRPDW